MENNQLKKQEMFSEKDITRLLTLFLAYSAYINISINQYNILISGGKSC